MSDLTSPTPEEALSYCVDQLLDGTLPMEACIERFPEHRTELQELLPVALVLQQAHTMAPRPAYRRQARSRLETRLAHSRRPPATIAAVAPPRPVAPEPGLAQRLARLFRPPSFRHALTALLVVLFLAAGGLLGMNTVNAAAPGDPLYGADRALEQVQLRLAGDEQTRTRLHLIFAEERLLEARELAAEGDGGNLQLALIAHGVEVAEIAERAGSDTTDAQLVEQIDQAMAVQERDLDTLFLIRGGEPTRYCDGPRADDSPAGRQHPLVAAFAIQYGYDYGPVMDAVCAGAGFGELALALASGRQKEVPSSAVLALRAANVGWGKLWQMLEEAEATPLEDGSGPPGRQDPLDVPPGLQGRDELPPGLQGRDELPPGLQNREDTPRGSQGRDGPPPGQEGRDANPPGQQDKDKENNIPPGLQDKDNTPPGLREDTQEQSLPPDQQAPQETEPVVPAATRTEQQGEEEQESAPTATEEPVTPTEEPAEEESPPPPGPPENPGEKTPPGRENRP